MFRNTVFTKHVDVIHDERRLCGLRFQVHVIYSIVVIQTQGTCIDEQGRYILSECMPLQSNESKEKHNTEPDVQDCLAGVVADTAPAFSGHWVLFVNIQRTTDKKERS